MTFEPAREQNRGADAGGNWLMNFPDVAMDRRPHTITLRQTEPGGRGAHWQDMLAWIRRRD